MQTQEKNMWRVFSTQEAVMKDKKLNDLIYGFYQANSYLTEDRVRYCYKADCSIAKLTEYFQKEGKDCPVSVNTLTNINKLLTAAGLFQETKINNKPAYILPDVNTDFVKIKTNTLRFLVNTATTNVIKVYAYLKARASYKTNYEFSKKELLGAIGYKKFDDSKNLQMITDVLQCLINNGLIEFHTEAKYVNGNKTFYMILDKVNEDYIQTIPSRTKRDESITAVPVPKTMEEFKSAWGM